MRQVSVRSDESPLHTCRSGGVAEALLALGADPHSLTAYGE